MRIIFRADASRQIGSGHVMRSSVLAQEAIARGHECIFLGVITDLEWVNQRLTKIGAELISENFQEFKINKDKDVLILDSYRIPTDDEFIQPDKWKLVVSISDELTPPYKVHLRIIPGMQESPYAEDGTLVLSGAKHLLIRADITKSQKAIEANPLKIGIVGGGSDPFGFCLEIGRILDSLDVPFEAHFFSPSLIESAFGKKFNSYPIGTNLDEIANDLDLAITTASTTSMEFIAREIPTAIACVVDNQFDYYEELGNLGLAWPIGLRTSVGEWDLRDLSLKELLTNQEIRLDLKKKIRNLVDLQGASRVLDQIEILVEE